MTKKSPIIKFSTALLCDDVRREDNGKEILIGVYTDNLLVWAFPADVTLCLWLLLETEISGKLEKEIRVVTAKGETIRHGTFSAMIHKAEKGFASFPLSNMHLTIEEAGVLKFQWRSPKKKWSTVLTKNVKLNPKSQQA